MKMSWDHNDKIWFIQLGHWKTLDLPFPLATFYCFLEGGHQKSLCPFSAPHMCHIQMSMNWKYQSKTKSITQWLNIFNYALIHNHNYNMEIISHEFNSATTLHRNNENTNLRLDPTTQLSINFRKNSTH